MKIHYYKEKNFGDALNPWLWKQLLPELFNEDDKIAFIGIGTLINENLPYLTRKARWRVIFSTGVGYAKGVPQIDESYKIYCLRGPLSAQKLGVSKDLAVTDGALLVKSFQTNSQKNYKFSYMPHYELAGKAWELVCKELNFGYIDPRWSVEKVLSCINQTEILLTEAMHGAIIADAFRVPWIPIVTNPTILPFKWQDWCQSIEVEYNPINLERLHHPRQKTDILSGVRLARDWVRQKKAARKLYDIASTIHPSLSSDKKSEQLLIELQEKVQQLKDDWKAGMFTEN
ncbi:MAG: polysaccharide pyruvyl transferase family protein [Hydrococcus sp. Prado102]|jgi:succinoglycan biosynthesis protein ExoV|nr:polysaccharide pyruvyl transferase family protein [Hydrococcus sp. Prado102]